MSRLTERLQPAPLNRDQLAELRRQLFFPFDVTDEGSRKVIKGRDRAEMIERGVAPDKFFRN